MAQKKTKHVEEIRKEREREVWAEESVGMGTTRGRRVLMVGALDGEKESQEADSRIGGTPRRNLRRARSMLWWRRKWAIHLKVVAAGPQQPQNRHDTPILELLWSRVGHGGLGPSWAY